jgi:flagellar FliL protein
MADQADTAPPVPAAGTDPGASPDEGKSKGMLSSLLPILGAMVLSAAGSWATVEFVLLPRLQEKLANPDAAAASPGSSAGHGDEADHGEGGTPEASYEFSNVVVNLAGTMGTRYLKTSFLVTGADPEINAIFEQQKPKLTDVTLNVLSSLSLADLEEPGAKNVLRERLVTAYNQALGRKVAEMVYFSDFVVQ